MTAIAPRLGDQRQWAYDPVGNLTSATDANSNVTSYTYDADNHLLTVTAPGPATMSYQYDANGNLTKRTDANTHVTTYSYDDANQLQSVLTPLNATWQYTYDANGNRTKTISPRGTTTFTYDELNRLKTVGYSDSTPGVSFTYDANNNRSQMTDGAGIVNYVYDALDRLTSATRGTDAFTYSYDAASNLTERVYAGGTTTDYTYDDDERPISVTSSSATTTYAYDPASELITTTRPTSNGWNDTRTYDHAGRLTEILDSNGTDTLQKLDYGYDANGNETSLTRLAGSESYQYDTRNRLTKVCYDNPCATATDYIAWSYDGVGNRLTETRPAGTTNDTYHNGDQLTQTSGPNGTTSYGYDSDGNQTSSGSTTYTYDLAERLTGATVGTTVTSYAYDGDGNRLTETTGTAATSLLWDTNNALPQLAVERDSSGAALRTYIQGPVSTISMLEGTDTFYLHTDRLGSITALTASNGTKEWSYTYEPFGTPRATSKIDPNAPVNPLRYLGQYDDPTTSLLDLRARQYDSTTGRLLGVDPLPVGPQSAFESAYVYAGQSPVNNVDLSGLVFTRAATDEGASSNAPSSDRSLASEGDRGGSSGEVGGFAGGDAAAVEGMSAAEIEAVDNEVSSAVDDMLENSVVRGQNVTRGGGKGQALLDLNRLVGGGTNVKYRDPLATPYGPGSKITLTNDTVVTYRPVSKSGDPAITLSNIPGLGRSLNFHYGH